MFKADLLDLSAVTEQPIDWLWPGVIALGKLTLLAGDPGLGKSFITMDIASRMTTGASFPFQDDQRQPCDVLLISAEDDPADTIKPRVRVMKGDAKRVRILTGVTDGEQWDDFNVEEHIWSLTLALADHPDTRLVVIDPISAFMPRSDSNNNTQVRSILKRLSDVAASRHVAILCVTHLRKSGVAAPAVHNLIGSLAFTAAARAVWMVQPFKENDGESDPSWRGLRPVKCNIASDRDGYVYRIANGRVEWVARRAFDTTPEKSPTAPRPTDVAQRVQQRLREWLKDGPRAAKEIRELSDAEGFNWNTVRFIKAELNIESVGSGEHRGWRLPD